MLLEGFTPYRSEDAEKYNRLRWWPGITFGDVLDKAADIYPDREALVHSDTRLTYSEVKEKTNRLANGLMALGIRPQDRVLVQLPNWHEFIFSYFALQKIGAIPVLVVARFRQYEINHLFRLTEAVSWLVPERYQKIDYLPIIDDVLKENPHLKHVVLVRGKSHKAFLSLEKLIENATLTEDSLAELANRRPDPLQVAHMGPTGGTTGLPKVVPRTHNDYISRAEFAARACEMTHEEITLVAAPVTHDLAFSMAICTTILTYGKLVLLDSTEPEDICKEIQREKVTLVVWVPTLAARLLNYEGRRDYDLSSLKKMHCGGGASSPELIKAVTERLGCMFLNGYGATEGMSTLTRLDYDLERICRGVGRPTCPYDTYKVVDQEGRELPPNTPGELVVKGPGVFTGYYKAPEENEKVFDQDGFFRTGDQAVIDEAGDVTLTGRIKEMINRGGESISAVEIENLIVTHPDVAAVAVIGMPDPDLGERVCAYVQPKTGATLGFEDIISFLRTKGASVLQLPERIEFIESIPLTKAEKMDKRALRDDIKKRLGTPP